MIPHLHALENQHLPSEQVWDVFMPSNLCSPQASIYSHGRARISGAEHEPGPTL